MRKKWQEIREAMGLLRRSFWEALNTWLFGSFAHATEAQRKEEINKTPQRELEMDEAQRVRIQATIDYINNTPPPSLTREDIIRLATARFHKCSKCGHEELV